MDLRRQLQTLELSPRRGNRRCSLQRICRSEYLVPALCITTLLIFWYIMMEEVETPIKNIRYTTVSEFFQQDDPNTIDQDFDFTSNDFGLIARPYDSDGELDLEREKNFSQWQRFAHQVAALNRLSGGNTQYKVLFMGRHGEGVHNVAESRYGTKAWDCYWAAQDGDGTVTWADAQLTDAGIAQAQKANDFWARQLSEQRMPAPESYITSPLTRCLETARVTFEGLHLPSRYTFVPEIKELFREAIGVHTCDRRSTRSYIHARYPTYTFERGFPEKDPLYSAVLRETDPAQDIRSKAALDDVFSRNSHTYISITSHSGEIGSLLRVMGHRPFRLGTGQVIPVLVKADFLPGQPIKSPPDAPPPWTKVDLCTEPPAP